MNTITVNRPETDISSLPEILTEDYEILPAKESFAVDSLEKAIWAAGKITKAEKNLDELTRKALYFHALIDAWEEKSARPYQDTVSYLGSLLRPFLADRLTGMKARSMHLPGYRIGFRTSPSRVVVDDTEKAIAYLEKQNPETIQVKKEVMKSLLKPLLGPGKKIPGVSVVAGEESLYVQEER